MEPHLIYEIIGYIASALVAVSLMMRSILRLRLLNMLGAMAFATYGLLIYAYPVALVNSTIALINIYYLRDIFTKKEFFTLLEVQPESEYLISFLNFYSEQIRQFIPLFKFEMEKRPFVFFVLRDMIPAGAFIGERYNDSTLLVDLDFVIPGFRDFKIGKYIFSENKDFFQERGIRRVCTESGNEAHERYLERMGFAPMHTDDGRRMFALSLT